MDFESEMILLHLSEDFARTRLEIFLSSSIISMFLDLGSSVSIIELDLASMFIERY